MRGTYHSDPLIDKSGTIAATNNSQILSVANPYRAHLEIYNPPTEVEPLYVNFTNPASTTVGGSIPIMPGGSLSYAPPDYVTPEQVNIAAVTVGHAFVCKEY
ncbi:MAG: hypothetical protein WCD45_04035 [Gallionella sp.]